MNRNDPTEVLSALLDGEPVEPAELAEALARPGTMEMLVDFVSLRIATNEDEPPALREPLEPPAPRTERPSRVGSRWLQVAAAAAIVLVSVVVTRWATEPSTVQRPMTTVVKPGGADLPAEFAKVIAAGSLYGRPPERAAKEKQWQ